MSTGDWSPYDYLPIYSDIIKSKNKAIPVTGLGGL
jgi:hypothetical protein